MSKVNNNSLLAWDEADMLALCDDEMTITEYIDKHKLGVYMCKMCGGAVFNGECFACGAELPAPNIYDDEE